MRMFIFLLFLATLLASSIHSEQQDLRPEFLFSYYAGDYEKAHDLLLKNAFRDSTTVLVWEERIHQQAEIPNCDYHRQSNPSIHAMAQLRVGDVQKAKDGFEKDWISLWGLATLSLWENDWTGAQNQIEEALALAPERPELLYFSADVAGNPGKSITLFQKYLSLPTDDPEKRRIAEYSIRFMEKTKGMPLNVVWMPSSFTRIDSNFTDGRLTVKGTINGNQSVNLMVDTGASGLTLEERKWQPRITTDLLLSGLGKNEMVKATRAVFDTFSLGKVTIRNPVTSISPTMKMTGIDGIAGTIVFGDYLVLLSLKSGKDIMLFLPTEDPLALLEKEGLHFKKEMSLPFRLVSKMIILKGRIKKSNDQMDILLDTGAQRSVLSTAAAKKYARINYFLTRQLNPTIVGVGGKTGTFIAENVEIQVGSAKREFPQMIALNLAEVSESLSLDIDMLLGRDFLEGYSLLIDYRKRNVTFLR